MRLTVLGGQLTPDTSFWSGGKVSTRAAASFVDFVSRYAFITPEGNKALVALRSDVLALATERLELNAGMQATAEILLGRRTVLEYLLSPVQKAWHESVRER